MKWKMKFFTISTFFPGFWWNFPEILQIVHTFPQILTLSVKKSKKISSFFFAKFSSKSSRKNFIFHSANEISFFILQNFDAAFLLKNCDWSGAKECESCRSRKMLKNAPTLAIVAVHTSENERLSCWKFHYFISLVQSYPYFPKCWKRFVSSRSVG